MERVLTFVDETDGDEESVQMKTSCDVGRSSSSRRGSGSSSHDAVSDRPPVRPLPVTPISIFSSRPVAVYSTSLGRFTRRRYRRREVGGSIERRPEPPDGIGAPPYERLLDWNHAPGEANRRRASANRPRILVPRAMVAPPRGDQSAN